MKTLIAIIVSSLLLIATIHAQADGSTTCFQFLADSKEGGAASEAHKAWVLEQVTAAGLSASKVDADAHMSLLVECVINRNATLGDATIQLIKELGVK